MDLSNENSEVPRTICRSDGTVPKDRRWPRNIHGGWVKNLAGCWQTTWVHRNHEYL